MLMSVYFFTWLLRIVNRNFFFFSRFFGLAVICVSKFMNLCIFFHRNHLLFIKCKQNNVIICMYLVRVCLVRLITKLLLNLLPQILLLKLLCNGMTAVGTFSKKNIFFSNQSAWNRFICTQFGFISLAFGVLIFGIDALCNVRPWVQCVPHQTLISSFALCMYSAP